MYDNETKNKFIELRAQEKALAAIAAELGISRHTAVNWNLEFKEEIKRLRAVEQEAFTRQIVASCKDDLTRLTAFKAQVEKVLFRRDLQYASTEALMRFQLQLSRQINHLIPDLSCLDQALAATPQQPAAPAQPTEAPSPAAPVPEAQAASPSPAPPPATPDSSNDQKLAA